MVKCVVLSFSLALSLSRALSEAHARSRWCPLSRVLSRPLSLAKGIIIISLSLSLSHSLSVDRLGGKLSLGDVCPSARRTNLALRTNLVATTSSAKKTNLVCVCGFVCALQRTIIGIP
jgi:hypothetical protein